MMDVSSIINNPIAWVVALVIVASLVRKTFRKVTGLLFTGLMVMKLLYYYSLLK